MKTLLSCKAAAALVLLGVSGNIHQAVAQAFAKGSTTISTGHGLGTFLGALKNDLNAQNIMSQSSLGPYYLKVDKGITNHLSFGVSTALMRHQWSVQPYAPPSNIGDAAQTAKVQLQRWAYSATGRLNYHFAKSKKFDPYFGAGIGYRSTNWSVDNPEFQNLTRVIPNTPIAFEFGIGARYYIMPGLGVYGEFGGSKSLLQGGLIYTMGQKQKQKPTGNTDTQQDDNPAPKPAPNKQGKKSKL